MNVQPNNFSLLIEGTPFVGDHANDDNLLQKGRPLNNVITATIHLVRMDYFQVGGCPGTIYDWNIRNVLAADNRRCRFALLQKVHECTISRDSSRRTGRSGSSADLPYVLCRSRFASPDDLLPNR
jgi:hypothetical protein